jgi:ABC-type siderophore export system fused ATPase/permease subunit
LQNLSDIRITRPTHGKSLRILLPIQLVLASKDLFSSLTTQKIKTLKQAEEYNRQHPNFKVEILLAEYETLKKNVSFEMNNDGNQPWNSPSANSFEKDPLKYYITRPSIIEVLGSKGSGKTALALKLALLFSSFNA